MNTTHPHNTDSPRVQIVTGAPEFVDSKGLRALFGISRSAAYDLTRDRLIKSVSLRRRGAALGRRLWDVASVREYLAGCYCDLSGSNGSDAKNGATNIATTAQPNAK